MTAAYHCDKQQRGKDGKLPKSNVLHWADLHHGTWKSELSQKRMLIEAAHRTDRLKKLRERQEQQRRRGQQRQRRPQGQREREGPEGQAQGHGKRCWRTRRYGLAVSTITGFF